MRLTSPTAVALLAVSVSSNALGMGPGDRRVYLHSGTIDLSFIEDFLDGRGVHVDLPEINVDLPPQAESAVSDALDKADAALERVFGEGGILDDAQTNVDTIVDDAVSNAQDVLGQIDLPEINLPDIDGIVEDALSRADETLAGVRNAIPTDTQQVVEDALNSAQQSVDSALEGVFGEGGVVDQALSDLPVDRLPEAATEAIENATGIVEQVLEDVFGQNDPIGEPLIAEIQAVVPQSVDTLLLSKSYVMVPTTSGGPAIPEPAACYLAAACVTATAVRRRG